MQKSFKILLATILAIFTIPFGGINVLADGGLDDTVSPDKVYEIEYTILNENGKDKSIADEFFRKPGIILEYAGKTYLQMTVDSADMVQAFSNESGDYVLVDERDGKKTMQLLVPNDLSDMKVDMHIVVTGLYDTTHSAILTFDIESKKEVDANKYELVTSDGKNGPSAEVTEPNEDENDSDEGPDEENGEGNNGESGDNESGEGKEEDDKGEGTEDESTEIEPLADGAYEFSYTTEGADLSRYYENKVIVIVDGDKQYLQLQGKSMRNFIEYLYIDGNRMDISAATNEAGAYIAQFEMDEKVEENAPLAFDMVINAMGRIMAHGSKITLDLSSAENIDSAELIEGVPATENETFVTSPEPVAYEYDSADMDLSRYYEDTINVFEKDGKQYIEFKGTVMANFIEALYVDGKKMAIKANEDNSYAAQVKHEKSLEEKFNFTMIINARGTIMSHSANIELLIPEEVIEIDSGKETSISSNQTLVISNDKNDDKVTIVAPPNLPDNTKITVEIISGEDKDVQVAKKNNYEVAGPVIDVTLDLQGDLKDEESFILTLPYDAERYDEDSYDVDIYYFDGKEWIAQNGKVKDGQISLEVKHFSKYGVFAKEKSKEDPKEDPKKDPNKEKVDLTPDKAYEINYTILHENGNAPSVADGFFKKPGILLEHDGKTYLQMTVESAEMVQALSNKYGDFVLVSENADGTITIQLRVNNDLSDMELDMHIVVPAGAIPGFPGYDEEHGAILTFDKDSRKEIDIDDHEVAVSDHKNNENGPFIEGSKGGNGGGNGGTGNNGKTPGKPSFGDNDDKGNDDDQVKPTKTDDQPKNPQTGDTSKIFLYTMLLIGSLIPLGIQLRRRFSRA